MASLNDRLNNMDGLLDRLERSLMIVLNDIEPTQATDDIGSGIPAGDGPTMLLRELSGLSLKADRLCLRLNDLGSRVAL